MTRPTFAVVEDLADVEASEWDRLTGRTGFYSSHRWLSGVADEPGATAHYVIGRNGRELIAAVPLYAVSQEANSAYAEACPPPTVVVGTRRGYLSGVLLEPSSATMRASRVAELMGAVDEAVSWLANGARADVGPAQWRYVEDWSADELARGGFVHNVVVEGAEARITLPGNAFGDYLAELPRRRRQSVRREMAAPASRGAHVERGPLAACVDAAGRLLAVTQGKYGRPDDEAQMVALLRRQAAAMGAQAQVLSLRDADSALIAFALAYLYDGVVWLRAFGADPHRAAGTFAYFNLGFYESIKLAYEVGATAVHLGKGSLPAKQARGASVAPLWRMDQGQPLDGAAGDPHRNRAALERLGVQAADFARHGELTSALLLGEPQGLRASEPQGR